MSGPIHRLRQALEWRRRLREFAKKVALLPIRQAGVDDEGDAFVRLENGTILFGHVTKTSYRAAHAFLPREARTRIPVAAFQVVLDAVIRYDEGALAYLGPKKQLHYRVQPGDTVAEMGAYLGHYSVRLAQEVGPTGRVLAIEANPHNHRILAKNVAANGLNHVTLIQTGVWHEPDMLRFSIRPHDHQSTSIVLERPDEETAEVPVQPLDLILAEAGIDEVALMIIQLNGAEPNALRGLTKVRPINLAIASRYAVEGVSTTPSILAWLNEHDYIATIEDEEYIFATRRP